MTICYLGLYKMDTRNRINIQAMRENGLEVIECQNREPGLKKILANHIGEYGKAKDDNGFVYQLAEGVAEHLPDIDKIITAHAPEWPSPTAWP